jgi:hypothetical protein
VCGYGSRAKLNTHSSSRLLTHCQKRGAHNSAILVLPVEPRPSVWEQDGFSTGDPSYRGAGTSYAYKSRLTTDCPPNTPANCRGNLAAVPQAAIDNPAGIWLFWDADSDYSRHTDKSRGIWRGAPRLSLGKRHQRSNGSLRRWARQTDDGHPAPAVVREHGADGKVYVPFQGCP